MWYLAILVFNAPKPHMGYEERLRGAAPCLFLAICKSLTGAEIPNIGTFSLFASIRTAAAAAWN